MLFQRNAIRWASTSLATWFSLWVSRVCWKLRAPPASRASQQSLLSAHHCQHLRLHNQQLATQVLDLQAENQSDFRSLAQVSQLPQSSELEAAAAAAQTCTQQQLIDQHTTIRKQNAELEVELMKSKERQALQYSKSQRQLSEEQSRHTKSVREQIERFRSRMSVERKQIGLAEAEIAELEHAIAVARATLLEASADVFVNDKIRQAIEPQLASIVGEREGE